MSVLINPPKAADNGPVCVHIAKNKAPAAPSFSEGGPAEPNAENIMRLGDKVFNGMVDTMRWILGLAPVSVSMEQGPAIHLKQKNAVPSCQALKVMTRADAHERVRIVKNGRHFGAILDFHHPQHGWSPGHILHGGITYQSPEMAEAEARHAVTWLKDWKEEPGGPSAAERR